MRNKQLLTGSSALFGRSQKGLLNLTVGYTGARYYSEQLPADHRKLRAPIDPGTYRDLVTGHYGYVDKSLLIKEFWEHGTRIPLITRPRRFGKTLNLSLVQHFFAKEVLDMGRPVSTANLFEGSKIFHHSEFRQLQGKFPVIFMSFQTARGDNWGKSYVQCWNIISQAYQQHSNLLSSEHLTHDEKCKIKVLISENISYLSNYETIKNYDQTQIRSIEEILLQQSIGNLCGYLAKHYGVKPILLIDEYDTPIIAGYNHNYYDKIINFMKGLFGELKDNYNIEKGMLTGILPVSKESLFSGSNNIIPYTIVDSEYQDYFGFTEEEVDELLKKSNLSDKKDLIKAWYNGYSFGCRPRIRDGIYNPFSIMQCIQKKGILGTYWGNSGDHSIIEVAFGKSSPEIKYAFQRLMQGESISEPIDKRFVFRDIGISKTEFWTLCLFSGYLTAADYNSETDKANLRIVNQETKQIFTKIIARWLSGDKSINEDDNLMNDLLSGDIFSFQQKLRDFITNIASIHDVGGRKPEQFYHGLMLGIAMFVNKKEYSVESNLESGYGRFDIAFIPTKESGLHGVILELKSLKENDKIKKSRRYSKLDNTEALLKKEAHLALDQIDQKEYTARLTKFGIEKILKVGIAYRGKDFIIADNSEDLALNKNFLNKI